MGKTVGHEFWEGGEEGESLFFFFLFFVLSLIVLASIWIACLVIFLVFSCFWSFFFCFSPNLIDNFDFVAYGLNSNVI